MKNLQRILLLSFTVALFGNFAQAQNADEIINKYVEVIGGKDKWKKVTSMVQTGKFPQGGMEFPFTAYSKTPNKSKVVVSFQGKEIVARAFDGKEAWGTNFMNMQQEKKNEEETKEMAKEEFEPKLIDYASKGHKAELAGKETIEGSECHKLKFTEKDGEIAYYFFDSENFALIMVRSLAKSGPIKGQELETFFSDYKDVGNGLMVPHLVESKYKGQTAQKIIIENVKLDESIDDKNFTFPGGK